MTTPKKRKEFKYRTTVAVRVPMYSTRCLPYLPLPQNAPYSQGAVVDVIVRPAARKKAVKKVG